jgi:hypothetical protein
MHTLDHQAGQCGNRPESSHEPDHHAPAIMIQADTPAHTRSRQVRQNPLSCRLARDSSTQRGPLRGHTAAPRDRVILCARDTATQSQRHRITKWPNHAATPWRGGTATQRRCRTITS